MPLKTGVLRGRALRHIFSDGLIVATSLISLCNNRRNLSLRCRKCQEKIYTNPVNNILC
ncbi:hypothetical protein HMPREF9120_01535 [Neisseria sp. oral taxon 020 str. F0370]|nr:hypothetical protein HMPREF9120_01535 [Neisseria sp. oral taxon 020 str. F0370]